MAGLAPSGAAGLSGTHPPSTVRQWALQIVFFIMNCSAEKHANSGYFDRISGRNLLNKISLSRLHLGQGVAWSSPEEVTWPGVPLQAQHDIPPLIRPFTSEVRSDLTQSIIIKSQNRQFLV
jgi:hypothetical protein